MGLYPIGSGEAYKFSKGIVSEIITTVDRDAFKISCHRVRGQEFPLRYPRAHFFKRKDVDSSDERWNDPIAPFSYTSVSYHGMASIDALAYVDVFGYHDRGAIFNNIVIDGIEPFGLGEGDDLADMVRRITFTQEQQFSDALQRHRDDAVRVRLKHGVHDRRYQEVLAKRPIMKPTVVDIARHEIELLFARLTFDDQPFGLIGLDLLQRSMNFAVELGTGDNDKSARYFGILELGRNNRWNGNPCLLYSMYVKKDANRYLHPFLVDGDALRQDLGNDLAIFLALSMVYTNKTRKFFARYATDVRHFYKKMFPSSVVPGQRAQP